MKNENVIRIGLTPLTGVLKVLLAAALMGLIPSVAQAKTTTWISITPGNSGIVGNWDYGVPASGDDVVFNGTNNGTCTFDSPSDLVLNNLRIIGYTGTITQRDTGLTITGAVGLTMSSGTFNCGGGASSTQITLSCPVFVGSGASFNTAGTTVRTVINGVSGIAGTGAITLGGNSPAAVVVGGGILTLAANTSVVFKDVSLTLNSGLNAGAGSAIKFLVGASTTRYFHVSSGLGITMQNLNFESTAIATPGTAEMNLASPMTINGALTITGASSGSGSFTVQINSGSKVTMLGSGISLGSGAQPGVLSALGSFIVLAPSANATVASTTYGDLIIAGAANTTLSAGGGITVTNLTISSGTFDLGGYSLIANTSSTDVAFHVSSGAVLTGGSISEVSIKKSTGIRGVINSVAGASTYINRVQGQSSAASSMTRVTLMGALTCNQITLVADTIGTAAVTLYLGSTNLTLVGVNPLVILSGGSNGWVGVEIGTSTIVYSGAGATVKGMTYNNLVLNPSSSTNYSNSGAITVGGTLTVGASVNTWDVTFGITVSGDVVANGMIGLAGSGGAMALRGGNQTVSGTGRFDVGDFSLSNSGTKTVTVPLMKVAKFIIPDAGVTLTLGAVRMTLSGAPSISGTFQAGASTLRFESSTSISVPGITYNQLEVGGTATHTIATTATVVGNLKIDTNSVLNLNASVSGLVLGGNLTMETGAKLTGVAGSTVTMTGAGVALGSGTNADAYFHNLKLTGSGASVTFSTNAGPIIYGTLTVDGATANFGVAQSVELNASGNPLQLISGTLVAGNSTVRYNGSGSVTVLPGVVYKRLSLLGPGTYTVSGPISLSGDLVARPSGSGSFVSTSSISLLGDSTYFQTFEATGPVSLTNLFVTGTVKLTGTGFSVSGNISNTAALTADAATRITLNGTGTQSLGGSGVLRLYDAVVAGASGSVTLVSTSALIENSLTVNTGKSFLLGVNALTLSGSGSPVTLNGTGTMDAAAATVVFSGTSATTLPALIVKNLGIVGATIYTASASITCSGDFTETDGNLVMGVNHLSVGGNLTMVGLGVFSASPPSMLSLYGSGKFLHMPSTVPKFANVVLGSGASYSLTGSQQWQVGEALIVGTSATLNLGPAALKLTGAGTPIVNNGTIVPGTSSVEYETPSGSTLVNIPYYTLYIKYNAGVNSTYYGPSAGLTLGGDLLVGPSAVFRTTSSVLLTGSGRSLTVNGSYTADSLTVSGSYTLGGTLTLAGTGAPLAVSGTLTPGTSTVVYVGASGATLAAMTYNNLTVSKVNQTFRPSGNFNVNGDLTIANSTTLDLGSARVTLAGGFTTNTGEIRGNASSTLVATGSGKNLDATNGSAKLGSLVVAGNYSVLATVGTPFVIQGDFEVPSSGAFSSGSVSLIVGGNLTSNGTFSQASTAPLVLTGANKSWGGSSNSNFGAVSISSPASYTMTSNVIATTVTVNGALYQVSFTISGSLSNTSIFTIISERANTETVGAPFSLTLIAKDNASNTRTDYTGVHVLTLTRVASSLGFPSGMTSGAAVSLNFSNGLVALTGFRFIATSASAITLSAVENGGPSGSVSLTVLAASFVMTTQRSGVETADTPFAVTLTVKNSQGAVVTNYHGPYAVTLTRSSTTLQFPSGYTAGAGISVTFSSGMVAITGFNVSSDVDSPAKLTVTDLYAISGMVSITISAGKTVTSTTGGTLTSTDGLKVEIPAGALPTTVPANTQVSVSTPSVATLTVTSGGFESASVTPVTVREISLRDPSTGLVVEAGTFSKPVVLEMPYTLPLPTGVSEANLRIFRYDAVVKRWRMAEGTQSVDTVRRVVITAVTKFSIFGVLPVSTASNLDTVKAYPSPYKPATAVDGTLKWINLPLDAVIKVYTFEGDLVKTINESTYGNAGWATWDGANETGEAVVGGVYFFNVIATGTSGKKSGKFVLIR